MGAGGLAGGIKKGLYKRISYKFGEKSQKRLVKQGSAWYGKGEQYLKKAV
ncbi:hypothetical protein FACS1894137_02730 [Spirochaetia bacterium]|nr:hypothetical protein FACS1894137_02730 [Spirochaetia bacterium]